MKIRISLVLACASLAWGCAPLGGSCNTANGVVDTFTVTGRWKKVTGYTTPRTEDELKTDFELYVFKPGIVNCSLDVVNGAVQGYYLTLGNYELNKAKKTMTITYDDLTTDSATYSFSGACDQTQMTLRYSSGRSEVFKVYSKTTADDDCT